MMIKMMIKVMEEQMKMVILEVADIMALPYLLFFIHI